MTGYGSNPESCTGEPVLVGVTGDACGTCSSTNIPLYDLSCHKSDDFYCRDCLTKMWNMVDDEIVRCPSCSNSCHFQPLQLIQDFEGINHEFLEFQAFDKIREQPEVMNNLIAFTAAEAVTFLDVTYGYFDDQILNTVELGGLPFYLSDGTHEIFTANPYYMALKEELTSVPKMMATPLELEDDLMLVLNNTIVRDTRFKYADYLEMRDIDLQNDAAILWEATNTFEDLNTIRENWVGMIRMWVDLLAWRHLERVASVEGGAAERMREPLSFVDVM
ncbi:hypothetical protein HBI67_123870 [Parastagonospora nodorum]|nr:hypothetical protein HBI12_017480 [Parastagonospora nodorum]KAH6059887.1 hypothetical protein HBI66_203060 [Parastagonospora nodorum]KAH6065112.1 hypothetical protein HBI67_123870 [Parastagonospora nodorum]